MAYEPRDADWSPDSVPVRWEYITPEKAEEYLQLNTDNYRNIRNWKVRNHADAMKRGAWRLCLVPISFIGTLGEKGTRLADGQHRLRAIVESGLPSWHLIAEGLTAEEEAEMDIGLKRLLSDHLRRLGYTNTMSLAASLRLIYRHENDLLREKGPGETIGTYVTFLRDNPDIEDAVRAASNLRGKIGGPVSVFATFYWLVGQISDPTGSVSENLNDFWERLGSDVGHEAGSPILALRRAIQALTSTHGASKRRLNQLHLLALMIKGWNGWLTGDQITILTWRGGGRNPEDFPILLEG